MIHFWKSTSTSVNYSAYSFTELFSQEIHEATKKEMPSTDLKTVDKMIEALKVRGKHCCDLVKH